MDDKIIARKEAVHFENWQVEAALCCQIGKLKPNSPSADETSPYLISRDGHKNHMRNPEVTFNNSSKTMTFLNIRSNKKNTLQNASNYINFTFL